MDDTISTISDYILIDQTSGQSGEDDFVFHKYSYLTGDQSEPESEEDSHSVSEANVTNCSEDSASDSESSTNSIGNAQDSDIDDGFYLSEDEEEEGEDKSIIGQGEEEEMYGEYYEGGDTMQDKRSEPELVAAVRNDAIYLVDTLLSHSSVITIYSAVMLSIAQGRDNITKRFIQHSKYEELKELNHLASVGALNTFVKSKQKHLEETDEKTKYDADVVGVDDATDGAAVATANGAVHTAVDDVNDGDAAASLEEEHNDHEANALSTYYNPLMLASKKNQFEIVRLLMQGGERIDEPHTMSCKCEICLKQTDTIRKAKLRLVTYQCLCSDSYVILSSVDPIFRAFELGQKLKKLSDTEKHYKADYVKLVDQVAGMSGRILDMVQNTTELDTILNEKAGSGLTTYCSLARLKIALRYQEKQFVSHPACQKKLVTLWRGTVNPEWVQNIPRTLLFMILLTITYPFLTIGYWCYPKHKLAKFMESPMIKFAANTISYLVFVGLVVAISLSENTYSGYDLMNDPDMGQYYRNYSNSTNFISMIGYVYIRPHTFKTPTILLSVWVIGLTLEIAKKLFNEGLSFFTDNLFNLLNFVQILLYLVSFGFRFRAVFQVMDAVDYFSSAEGWEALANNDTIALEKTYWLRANRQFWVADDPTIISEAVFAIGSILTICKITYAFTVSERIGPLVLSMAEMFEDVTAFMMLFFFIITAFCVGFHNVYWYLYSGVPRTVGEPPPSQFESINDVITLFFWSIFGLGKFDAASTFRTILNGEGITLTGNIMFALYNWLMVIILINILIAMMSKSYTHISEKEDMEWKFARTKLFLEYIREGSTLPPPLNILPQWTDFQKLFSKWKCSKHRCCRASSKEGMAEEETPIPENRRKTNSVKQRIKKKITGHTSEREEPSAAYKDVIFKVIVRFIGKRNSDEDEDGGFKQLGQDISTLRQDLMRNVIRQIKERETLMNIIKELNKHVVKTREACTRQHAHIKAVSEERVAEIKSKINGIENHVNVMFDAVGNTFQELEHLVDKRFEDFKKDFMKSIEDVTANVQDVDTAVSEYGNRVSAFKETLQGHAQGINVLRNEMAVLSSNVARVQQGLDNEFAFSDF